MSGQMQLLLEQLARFLVMLLIGFAVVRLKWLDKKDFDAYARLLIKLLLPLFLLTTIPAAGTRDDLLASLPLIALAAILILVLMALGILSARLAGLTDKTARAHTICNAISNIGFMGIPLGSAMFGAPGILGGSMFMVANDVLMWSVGRSILTHRINIGFAHDSGVAGGARPRFTLIGLINANLVMVALGCGLLALEINPAGNLVWDTLSGISSICRYLPMLIIGGMLGTFDFRQLRRYLPILAIIALKLLLVPAAAALLIFWLFPGPPEVSSKMLIIGLALPTFSTSTAAASAYGADEQYAAACTTLTTLASMVTLPIVISLVEIL